MGDNKPLLANKELVDKLHSKVGLEPLRNDGLLAVKVTQLLRIQYCRNLNLRLAIDSCTRCGACLTACPAYVTTGDYLNSPLGRLTLARVAIRRGIRDLEAFIRYFHLCLTCRRCAWTCPLGIDVADVTRVVRSAMYEAGVASNYVAVAVNNLEDEGNFLGLPKDMLREVFLSIVDEVKAEAGIDVGVKIDEPAYALLIPASCADYFIDTTTFKGYVLFLNTMGIDFTLSTKAPDIANYGLFLDERHMRLIADRIIEAARGLGVKLVIAGECGHGWRVFKNYIIPRLREYGIEGVHIFHLVAKAIREGNLRLKPDANGDHLYVYMDPCHYARGGDLTEEPRFIMRHVVKRYVDLRESRGRAICCGGSGGLLATELSEKALQYSKLWYEEVLKTGAQYVVWPCATCKVQLTNVLPQLNKIYGADIRYVGLMDLVYRALLNTQQSIYTA